MTCQYSFARLRATVMQRQMQGLKRAFLRLCNTCNTYAYAILVLQFGTEGAITLMSSIVEDAGSEWRRRYAN